jgi:hypothetical protein
MNCELRREDGGAGQVLAKSVTFVNSATGIRASASAYTATITFSTPYTQLVASPSQWFKII